MYRFDWDFLVTDELLVRLGRIAGLPETFAYEAFIPPISRVLAAVGGLPLCHSPLDSVARTTMATAYLMEAVERFLVSDRLPGQVKGFLRQESEIDAIGTLVVTVPVTEINWASRQQLAALPDIGQDLADRIVEERTKSGYFSDLNDLVVRVPGFGPKRGETLRDAVSFAVPSSRRLGQATAGGLDEGLAEVIAACGYGPAEERFAAALDLLATNCSREPHPAVEHSIIRHLPEAAPQALAAEWVGLLDGPEYYESVPLLIAEATSSIELCMFHVAFASDEHPTRRLLEALVAAKAREVDIRVLLDCDRREDPYKSTIINTPAKEYLGQYGIACKFDQTDRLLHSKYLIIDATLVALGSHNWSTGSYFEYDDLSVVIQSHDLAVELRDRFDELWTIG